MFYFDKETHWNIVTSNRPMRSGSDDIINTICNKFIIHCSLLFVNSRNVQTFLQEFCTRSDFERKYYGINDKLKGDFL